MKGRPLSDNYKVSEENFLINEMFVAKNLVYSKNKFEAKASDPLKSSRLLFLHRVCRNIPCKIFNDHLKLVYFEPKPIEKIVDCSFPIHKVSSRAYEMYRVKRTNIPYDDVHKYLKSIPFVSEIQIPKDWLMTDLIRWLDILMIRHLNDVTKYDACENLSSQMSELDSVFEKFGSSWDS